MTSDKIQLIINAVSSCPSAPLFRISKSISRGVNAQVNKSWGSGLRDHFGTCADYAQTNGAPPSCMQKRGRLSLTHQCPKLPSDQSHLHSHTLRACQPQYEIHDNTEPHYLRCKRRTRAQGLGTRLGQSRTSIIAGGNFHVSLSQVARLCSSWGDVGYLATSNITC